jgi:MYND finger
VQSQACCFHCGKLQASMAQCQKCCFARFCSKACQTAAWQKHKESCKTMRAAWSQPVARDGGKIVEEHDHVAFLADVLQVRARAHQPLMLF